MLSQLKQTAQDLGLPFGHRTMTFNSRKAQVLGKWAETMGKGDAFHQAVFRSYFEHGKNIAQLDVLKGVAASIGLDEGSVAGIIEAARYQNAVDSDWQRSHQMGITAVPTFYRKGETRVGAQPYEDLEKWLFGGSAA